MLAITASRLPTSPDELRALGAFVRKGNLRVAMPSRFSDSESGGVKPRPYAGFALNGASANVLIKAGEALGGGTG